MPDLLFTDVVEIPLDAPTLKEQLLQDFQVKYTPGLLYRKEGDDYVALSSQGDLLTNNGYFIKKETLTTLINHISTDEGGIWINFGLGNTYMRGNEIQLVITATESDAELSNSDAGVYCVTTHNEGDSTDPPYTGITSPKQG